MTGFDLALFGDPVEHSWSPAIQQAALDAVGLAGTYRAVKVDAEGFRQGCIDLRKGRWQGANVTMPHKRRAAEETDERSVGAERSGSVNTIVVDGSRLVGHSTDIDGIQNVWREAGLSTAASVMVLGAGGAAAAALIALDTHDLFISARRSEAVEQLSEVVDVAVRPVPWGTAVPGAVIVNATPLGMRNETLPPGLVEESAGLLDMAYRRGTTPAVRVADRAGLPYGSGTDLLLAQAVASFAWWTGLPAPADEMRVALQMAQATC
jgi:shikimate dehydrogenase